MEKGILSALLNHALATRRQEEQFTRQMKLEEYKASLRQAGQGAQAASKVQAEEVKAESGLLKSLVGEGAGEQALRIHYRGTLGPQAEETPTGANQQGLQAIDQTRDLRISMEQRLARLPDVIQRMQQDAQTQHVSADELQRQLAPKLKELNDLPLQIARARVHEQVFLEKYGDLPTLTHALSQMETEQEALADQAKASEEAIHGVKKTYEPILKETAEAIHAVEERKNYYEKAAQELTSIVTDLQKGKMIPFRREEDKSLGIPKRAGSQAQTFLEEKKGKLQASVEKAKALLASPLTPNKGKVEGDLHQLQGELSKYDKLEKFLKEFPENALKAKEGRHSSLRRRTEATDWAMNFLGQLAQEATGQREAFLEEGEALSEKRKKTKEASQQAKQILLRTQQSLQSRSDELEEQRTVLTEKKLSLQDALDQKRKLQAKQQGYLETQIGEVGKAAKAKELKELAKNTISLLKRYSESEASQKLALEITQKPETLLDGEKFQEVETALKDSAADLKETRDKRAELMAGSQRRQDRVEGRKQETEKEKKAREQAEKDPEVQKILVEVKTIRERAKKEAGMRRTNSLREAEKKEKGAIDLKDKKYREFLSGKPAEPEKPKEPEKMSVEELDNAIWSEIKAFRDKNANKLPTQEQKIQMYKQKFPPK